MPHHHRAGSLRQSNKKHKSRGHLTSKRAIKEKEGGKVNAGGSQRIGLKQQTTEHDLKQDRLNRARQLKEQKRNGQYLQRRIGSGDGPPRVVALIPLSSPCDTNAIRQAFLTCKDDVTSVIQEGGAVTACFKSLKQRFAFLQPSFNILDALEAAKVADLIMFVLDVGRGSEGAIRQDGDLIISAIRAQGMPGAAVGIIQGLEHHAGSKSQADLRRFGNRFFETEFGDKVKIAESINAVQLLRVLSTPAGTGIQWRQGRAYVIGDALEWTADATTPDMGILKIKGYVRGKPLSVNQLVHVQGLGTFHMSRITKVQREPCPLKDARGSAAAASGGAGMDATTDGNEEEVLAQADPSKMEDLQMLADADELAGEQTWPTKEEEAEMMEGGWEHDDHQEKGEETKKRRKKGLKMSDYQASWFEGDEEAEKNEEEGQEGEEEDDNDGDDVSMGDTTSMDATTKEDEGRKKAQKLEEDDLEFPDEVDTPEDRPARERFARYRALKSFRTSPWDPKESLPRDYARIFQFQNFQACHSRVVSEVEEVEKAQNQMLLTMRPKPSSAAAGGSSKSSGSSTMMEVETPSATGSVETALASRFDGYVASGTYVILHLTKVPLQAWQSLASQSSTRTTPITTFSLLRYEKKVSVLHFTIQKHPMYDAVIKSKEQLVFYTGFRTFEGKPIFSEHNLNCDKHKFSRFLHGGRFAVASVYGPVTMPPCPLLIFKETKGDNGVIIKRDLVATGTLASVDPDRIILKRILLTGYPIRVKRRGAVVKRMFYNPDDVKWFKPAELFTKLGAVGHIKEPVGTHGLMKVRFNRVINQSDTICLALFKRIYPKFLEDVGGA